MDPEKPSPEKNWFLTGIYYPGPFDLSKIPSEEHWSYLDEPQLKDVNKQLIGKPLLLNHPFDKNGNPLKHDEWGQNYRGKIIHTEILPDGKAYFMAKVTVNKPFKNILFKKDLKNNRYSEFSVCHVKDPDTGRQIADHIAILEPEKARFRGCNMIEILKIPKKRFEKSNNTSGHNKYLESFGTQLKNYFIPKRRISSNSKKMAEQPTTLSDDQNASSDPPGNQLDKLAKIIQSPATNPDEVRQYSLGILELVKKLSEENESLVTQKQRLEEEDMKRKKEKVEDLKQEYFEIKMSQAEAEGGEITDEARTSTLKMIQQIYDEDYGKSPIDEQVRHLNNELRYGRQIAVCSRDGAKRHAQQIRAFNEYQQKKSTKHQPQVSSIFERFVPSTSNSAPSKSSSSSDVPQKQSVGSKNIQDLVGKVISESKEKLNAPVPSHRELKEAMSYFEDQMRKSQYPSDPRSSKRVRF